MLILNTTLYSQKALNFDTFIIVIVILTVFILIEFYYLGKKGQKHLSFMNKFLIKIENYESLPSLETLKKLKN